MTERNLCKEAACPAACCKNLTGRIPGSESFFLKAFPHAIPLNSEEELKEKVKKRETGVYYFSERSWIYFSIGGNCPNLLPDYNCKIHGERFYPKACLNMLIGSEDCHKAQELNSFSES